MKIIQTLWTLPGIQQKGEKNTLQNRLSGGWLLPKYYYFALAYSCLSIKKFYPQLELMTDDLGAEILINKLNLPYSKISFLPDYIQDLPSGLWAFPKIYSYSIQNEPFIHIDNDIFLWDKFPNEIENSELIVQNYEVFTKDYDIALKHILDNFHEIPNYIKTVYDSDLSKYRSVNAGIFGGKDVDFIKNYTNEVFAFLENNIDTIKKFTHKSGVLNVVFEQLTFLQLAKQNKKNITTLFKEDEEMVNMIRFEMVPIEHSYIHCLGELKKNEIFCKQIEFRLRNEFPNTYAKIANILGLKDIKNSDDFKHYVKTQESFGKCNNRQDLLDIKLTLNKENIIYEKEGKFFIKDKKEYLELSGWNKYLMFFLENKISGNELVERIVNSNVGKIFSVKEIEDNVLALVTQSIVLKDRLIIL